MSLSRLRALAALTAVLLSIPGLAFGQPTFESAGERALGMGGAFVAVADDATATHWNPAGLVSGGPAGVVTGWHRFESGDDDLPATPGPYRRGGNYTSLGTWPLGVSYGNFNMTRLAPTEGDAVGVETLRTNQYSVTILQSVLPDVVVGSTLKYMRGDVTTALSEGDSVEDALSRTDDLEGERSGTFDFDLAVMARASHLRIGVTWKNVQTPTFGDVSSTAITIPRQLRLGVAVLPTAGLTLAMDLDLETVDLPGDVHRMLALGGEGKISSRFHVRSGVRWSLEGARRLVAAAGASVSIRQGFWFDGHYTQGDRGGRREFGIALRAGL